MENHEKSQKKPEIDGKKKIFQIIERIMKKSRINRKLRKKVQKIESIATSLLPFHHFSYFYLHTTAKSWQNTQFFSFSFIAQVMNRAQ